MRFDPHLLDEIRSRLPVSAVVSRKVALKKQGREFAGLSPFKAEKTPSFFVNDQKGFYHCFASGEHGDIFTFLMKTEGLSFPEAVERLAQEAGVKLPDRKKADPSQTEARLRLYEVLEAATKMFEANLNRAQGREAPSYLQRRGVSDGTILQFRLGYAGGGRRDLADELLRQGFRDDEMIAAGLLIAGPDIPKPYDRFRNRVIFPIRDMKNRVIAFGGRALDPSQPAKYLNSPETQLFHKGHILFNAAQARESAFASGEVVVVEGYMDVIALHQAGITAAVAPLGTALTPDQLSILWRMAPEPVLCFDGDSAGQKAAFRAIDTCLPALKPGHSVRFAFLPDGLDPDDMIRERGPAAFRRVIDQAMPLEDVLWQREWARGEWRTAEQRALLEKSLREATARISDSGVRYHYGQAIRAKLFAAWRATGQRQAPSRPSASGRSRSSQPGRTGPQDRNRMAAPASISLRQSTLASTTELFAMREALIMKLVLENPWLLDDVSEELGALPLASAQISALRDKILDLHARSPALDSVQLHYQLHESGYGECLKLADRSTALHFNRPSAARDAHEEVVGIWRELTSRHVAERELRSELRDALRQFELNGCEGDFERIVALKQLLTSIEQADKSS